ncbi:MAG: hypothetical protein E7104_01430 [Prevotella sp.]|nr:hypothetical protein [Prevotella sp.]
MEITITRYRIKNNIIDGKLYIKGREICDTTENRNHAILSGTYSVKQIKCSLGKRNIPIIAKEDTHTCPCEACQKAAECNSTKSLEQLERIEEVILNGIKTGKAEEEYTQQARMVESTLSPHAPKIAMPMCPQIKTGNSSMHLTDGSILVGRFLMPGVVIRSAEMFDTLYDRIRKTIERGNNVHITILEKYTNNN